MGRECAKQREPIHNSLISLSGGGARSEPSDLLRRSTRNQDSEIIVRVDERSRGVFNGKIIVREGAQKTDAFQSNKNLLLSEKAEVDTKPQLVINANDVKCSHGTTIGQIDEDAVFYLRARGIAEAEARGLLTYAFVADVLEKIRFDVIRKRFEAQLMSWLVNGKQSRGGGE